MVLLAVPALAGADTDGALHIGPATDRYQTFSRPLGKSYPLATNVRVTPYLEVGAPISVAPMPRMLVPLTPEPAGRVLIGGLTRYSLAPHWTLSFDVAIGVPLLSAPMAISNPVVLKNGDDDHFGRSGVKLGYTLGRNFQAFAIAEVSSLRIGPPPALLGSFRPVSQSSESALRLGFSYRY
jgi:hypothetical protein